MADSTSFMVESAEWCELGEILLSRIKCLHMLNWIKVQQLIMLLYCYCVQTYQTYKLQNLFHYGGKCFGK